MKKSILLLSAFAILLTLSGCFGAKQASVAGRGGEVVGVSGRSFVEPAPYGMVKINRGFLKMGLETQDSLWGMKTPRKDVSVDGFWMDDTEITNSEYKQFVAYVRDSILRTRLADPAYGGDDMAATVQRDIVDPYVAFNYGRDVEAPQVTFPVPDPEDLKLLMDATKIFVDMGGTVPAGPVREKLGWRDPVEGEEVLGGVKTVEPPKVDPPKDAGDALSRLFDQAALPMSIGADDITEGFAEQMAGEWEEQLSPLMEAIRRAAAEAGDFASFLTTLEGLQGGTADMNNRLAAATFVARVMGAGRDG